MPSFADSALLISAHKRPYYLKQVLASWSAVPQLQQLDHVTIALGRSPREDEQEAIIAQWIKGMDIPVRIRWDSAKAVVSPGMHRALGEALEAEFAYPGIDFVIASEEDQLVSDDVLAYMSWARRIFGADPQVLTISAHNPLGQGWLPPYDDTGADQEVVRLHPLFHPWCWATWKDRWQQYLLPTWDWEASTGTSWHDNGYDWQICRVMQKHDLRAVTPDASRSQNIGQHEGYYANPADFERTQAMSFRPSRPDPSYRFRPAPDS